MRKNRNNTSAKSGSDFFFSVKGQESDGLSSLAFLHQLSRRYHLLTFEEERELGRRIKQGDEEAFNTLVCSNMRLSLWMASKYTSWSRMPYIDMVQEGLIGVMRAARKYDYQRGIRFSTYATWWVRQAIGRAIMKTEKTVAVPIHLQRFCLRVLDASAKLANEEGNIPTPESLAVSLKVDVWKVRDALHILRMDTVSLDELVNPSLEESQTVGEQLRNQTYLGPLEALECKSEQRSIIQYLQSVMDIISREQSPRDFQIFQSCYGLDNDFKSKPYEKIADEVGLTSGKHVRRIVLSIWEGLQSLGYNEKEFKQYLVTLLELESLSSQTASIQMRSSLNV